MRVIEDSTVTMFGIEVSLPVEFEYDYQPYEPTVINPVDMAYEGSDAFVEVVAIRVAGIDDYGDEDFITDITYNFTDEELDDLADNILERIEELSEGRG